MTRWLRRVLCAVVLLIGCTNRQAPTEVRELQGIGPGQPTVATECAATQCWCDDPIIWAPASPNAAYPPGYVGNGARSVTIVMPTEAMIHLWPAGLCGDLMAASGICWCLDGANDREPEMLRRCLHAWGPMVTFNLEPGRSYWVRQDSTVAPVSSVADTVVVR